MKIRVGTVVIEVCGLEAKTESAWSGEFSGFLANEAADLRVEYASRGDDGRWLEDLERDADLALGDAQTLVRGSRWQARVDVAAGEATVRTAGEWPQEVRVLLSPLAQARGVWLGRATPMHGAAFALDGTAVALVGESGAGKTTCARFALSRGCRLLAEELVWAGGAAAGRPAVHMLPFMERHELVAPQPIVLPLAAVFVLQQANDDVVVPLKPGERLRALCRRTSHGFVLPAVADRAFDAAAALEAAVPVMGLRFTRSDRFVDVIGEWLRSGEGGDPVQSTPQATLDDGEDS